MITQQQIALVQESWTHISTRSQKMGEEFYQRLFESAPELRPMFRSEPKDQAMKFMFMISYLVLRLDQVRDLQEEIVKLATRHKHYGAKIQHFTIIGDALLWSLEKNLGNEWDSDTADAWQATYKFISDLMIGVFKA